MMHNPTDIALSRLMAQARAMDVTANNLANANTAGYKAQRVLFSDWLSPQVNTALPRGDHRLAYTQDRATYRDQAAGAINHTGNPLDVAIAGDGFFSVQTPQGVRLTRAGRFTLMTDGTVADSDGHPLLDTANRPLSVPPGQADITIAGDGTLSTPAGTVGRIGVVTATNINALRAQGGRLYDTTGGVQPLAAPHVVQGAFEDSNVQPVLEMTRMMNMLREFQYTAQFVQSEGDRMQSAIDKITRTG